MQATISVEQARRDKTDFRLDPDLRAFVTRFRAVRGQRVCVVGAHDEDSANTMAREGLDVTGIDLRAYDEDLPACNFNYIRGDFCNLPEFHAREVGKFDHFVCLSALEHFGLGSYQEGIRHPYYDVIAMRKAWDLLKFGGMAWVTVPFGAQFMEVVPHWRTYDYHSAMERIVQDFKLVGIEAVTAEDLIVDGRERKIGDIWEVTGPTDYLALPPNVVTLIVMRKVPVDRMAPDRKW